MHYVGPNQDLLRRPGVENVESPLAIACLMMLDDSFDCQEDYITRLPFRHALWLAATYALDGISVFGTLNEALSERLKQRLREHGMSVDVDEQGQGPHPPEDPPIEVMPLPRVQPMDASSTHASPLEGVGFALIASAIIVAMGLVAAACIIAAA